MTVTTTHFENRTKSNMIQCIRTYIIFFKRVNIKNYNENYKMYQNSSQEPRDIIAQK